VDAEKRVLMTMIVMQQQQQQHKNSKEGKDLFRKSIIRYQIYPTIYSQLDCFEAPKAAIWQYRLCSQKLGIILENKGI
jgi:hypothetical protein